MNRLNVKISNPIVRGVTLIIWYIGTVILLIPAIPYAIVRGMCNLDYYGEWLDFINKYNPLLRQEED